MRKEVSDAIEEHRSQDNSYDPSRTTPAMGFDNDSYVHAHYPAPSDLDDDELAEIADKVLLCLSASYGPSLCTWLLAANVHLHRTHRPQRDGRQWKERLLRAQAAWLSQMQQLSDAYLQYKRTMPNSTPTHHEGPDSTPRLVITAVDIFGM